MSRESHATCTRTLTKTFLARVQNHQRQYFTAVVVAKQHSRSKQDQRVFLSVYKPGLALKQIKLEESTGDDLVSAVDVRANPGAARPEAA